MGEPGANKLPLWAICLFALLFLSPSSALSDTVAIESGAQFDFARTLMKGGEYSRAILEFERFIYFFPRDEKVPRARYLIGVCRLDEGRFETARKVFELVVKAYPSRPLAGEALFMIGESYYREGASGEAARYFRKVIEGYPESDLKNAALYRLGWAEMREEKWAEASETFKKVGEGSPHFGRASELASESLLGPTLPRKRPALAGGLAAVLPGLGHAYVGRYKDGAVAFLLNGLFILAAVESFQNDQEALGSILGFLELGWYTGNVYSAVNAAHKYNRKMKSDFLERLNDSMRLGLLGGGTGQAGFAVRVRF